MDQYFKPAANYLATSNVGVQGLGIDFDLGYVTLAEDDSVLLVGQTDASENGVYLITAQGSERREDMDAQGDFSRSFYIQSETPLKQYFWAYDSGFVLGTSDLVLVLVNEDPLSNARTPTETQPGTVSNARSMTGTQPGTVSNARSMTQTPPSEVT